MGINRLKIAERAAGFAMVPDEDHAERYVYLQTHDGDEKAPASPKVVVSASMERAKRSSQGTASRFSSAAHQWFATWSGRATA